MGLVVIITFKDTVLQVPQVCAAMRLFSGPQYAELEGFHLNEMTLSEDTCEEEPEYFQSVCTISSTQTGPPSQTSTEPEPQLPKPPDPHS